METEPTSTPVEVKTLIRRKGPKPEYIEGPEAAQRFDCMMTALVAIPHSVIAQREKAYRKKVDANPDRRGPKRKA
jgi:hypothetical protein